MEINTSYKRELQRKLIHLSSLWMIFAIFYLSRQQAIIFFAFLYVFILISELLRKYNQTFRSLYYKLFGKLMRSHEVDQNKFSFVGSYYFVLAVFIAVVFFSKEVAILSVTVMLICDTCAALIGKKFGKTKLCNKSLEGSLAFMFSGFLMAYVIYNLLYLNINFLMSAFVAVVLATVVELVSNDIHMDDNLTIVLAMGGTMELLLLCIN